MNPPVSELPRPTPPADPVTGRFHLSAHRVIDVEGADAAPFLQGQLCNDVAALQPGRAQINGYCTPKGRLLASFVLQRRPDGFRLILPEATVAEAFAKRLGMFVMRSAVTLRVRDDVAVVGLIGDASAPDGLPTRPEAVLEATDDGDASLLRWHDDPVQGHRLLGVLAPRAAADLPDGEQAWRLGDIRAGLPSVRTGTVESFVPQMVNFREIDGLSFKKGCYPGQEIVARMHYLGKQKRHMRRFVATGATSATGQSVLPSPGQSLGEGGAAEVVDAIATVDGIELLAVVRVGPLEHGLSLGDQGPTAIDAVLPYRPGQPADEQAEITEAVP